MHSSSSSSRWQQLALVASRRDTWLRQSSSRREKASQPCASSRRLTHAVSPRFSPAPLPTDYGELSDAAARAQARVRQPHEEEAGFVVEGRPALFLPSCRDARSTLAHALALRRRLGCTWRGCRATYPSCASRGSTARLSASGGTHTNKTVLTQQRGVCDVVCVRLCAVNGADSVRAPR